MTDTTYKWEVGKWYKTRNGLDAKISDDDFKGPSGCSLAGKIQDKNGVECVCTWHEDGSFKNQESEYDLMPPVETKEFWVNANLSGMFYGYKSKSNANANADHDRIGLLKITITGDDYTVEKVKNERLREENARLQTSFKRTLVTLIAAVSLLERGEKGGAPSDKMFEQMLADYRKQISRARAAIREGGEDG